MWTVRRKDFGVNERICSGPKHRDMTPKLDTAVADNTLLGSGGDRGSDRLVQWQARFKQGAVGGIAGLFVWLTGEFVGSSVGTFLVFLGAVLIFAAFLCSLVWLLLSVLGPTLHSV